MESKNRTPIYKKVFLILGFCVSIFLAMLWVIILAIPVIFTHPHFSHGLNKVAVFVTVLLIMAIEKLRHSLTQYGPITLVILGLLWIQWFVVRAAFGSEIRAWWQARKESWRGK